jgi:copper chaperone
MAYVKFDVTDMSCGHCKAAVEGELGKLPRVTSNANPEQGIVEVRYDESRVVPEDLRRAIEDAGYTVAA